MYVHGFAIPNLTDQAIQKWTNNNKSVLIFPADETLSIL